MIFTNTSPDSEEWTAFIELLNTWTPEDRQLRHIIQYARSGPFYPTDMFVDLLKEYAEKADQVTVWCASGEEGIEFSSESKKEVEDWIADEVAGEGNSDEPMSEDYYQLVSMTRRELEALPEV